MRREERSLGRTFNPLSTEPRGQEFLLVLGEAEKMSNIIYSYVVGDALVFFEDPEKADHGWPHSRRVEKLIKDMFGGTDTLRATDSGLTTYLKPLFLAARFHDITYVITDDKYNHALHSSLYTILSLKEFQQKNQENLNFLSDEEIYATAAIIYYHSNPEQLVNLQSLPTQHEFAQVFNNAGSKVGAFIDSLKLEDFYEQLQRGEWLNETAISRLQMESLTKAAALFALADKIDTLNFPKPSIVRTLQTKIELEDGRKERPFYYDVDQGAEIDYETDALCLSTLELLEGQPSGVEIELVTRALLGCQRQVADCDFDRLLYELLRNYSVFSELAVQTGCIYAKNRLIQALNLRVNALSSFVSAMIQEEDLREFFVGIRVNKKRLADDAFIESFIRKLKKNGDVFSLQEPERRELIARMKSMIKVAGDHILKAWGSYIRVGDHYSFLPYNY